MSRRDPLSDQMQIPLLDLSTSQSTCSIFKAPGGQRRVNERAYEPEIVSIGPYHRGKDNLKNMEEHKQRYRQTFLQRRTENSFTSYVEAMIRGVEERARQCYDPPVSLGKDEFVEMLLLDGCFIVELICKIASSGPQPGDKNDPVIGNWHNLSRITADMLLLENQLPFFVLSELFSMAMPNEKKGNLHGPQQRVEEDPFVCKASGFFKWIFPGSQLERRNTISPDKCKHLLDLVYHTWLPSPSNLLATSEEKDINWEFMRSAKELKEAGIKFRKLVGGSNGLFQGVDFKNGLMEIPCLKIDGTTETLLRNLIAYEQCLQPQLQHMIVTDFSTLMDCLINTEEDVRILRHCGIIENGLGDDQMVCSLFNKIGINVMISGLDHSYYAQVFKRVKDHCARKRNVWLADLWRSHFNSPWSLISFLAALALLLLTSVQTVFTVMSYFHTDRIG